MNIFIISLYTLFTTNWNLNVCLHPGGIRFPLLPPFAHVAPPPIVSGPSPIYLSWGLNLTFDIPPSFLSTQTVSSPQAPPPPPTPTHPRLPTPPPTALLLLLPPPLPLFTHTGLDYNLICTHLCWQSKNNISNVSTLFGSDRGDTVFLLLFVFR